MVFYLSAVAFIHPARFRRSLHSLRSINKVTRQRTHTHANARTQTQRERESQRKRGRNRERCKSIPSDATYDRHHHHFESNYK